MNKIEDDDLMQAEKIIQKSLKKDTLDPGAYYAFSLLYLDPAYPEYNIDSAHYYILKSLKQFPVLEEKYKKKLTRAGIDSTVIDHQKLKVDSSAFAVARQINTENSYNYFLEHYPNTLHFEKAVSLRNQVAFQDAVNEGTYTAYEKFFKKYPLADQVPLARKRYNDLLFETKIKDNKLQTYVSFLRDFPDTPYRRQVEKNIFELMTADNKVNSYGNFINRYPESYFIRKAYDFLYHTYKEDNDPHNFSNEYGGHPDMDSLMNVTKLESLSLAPFVDNGEIGFLDLSGNPIIQDEFDETDLEHKCSLTTSDYLVISDRGISKIIGLNKKEIFSGNFEKVEDKGAGWLKIITDNYPMLVHKSGYRFPDDNYTDLDMILNSYMIVKKNDKWGLKTTCGRTILNNEFDKIYTENSFLILEKNGRFTPVLTGNILKAIEGESITLEFPYDEVESINENYLLCFQDNKETLLDKNLNNIIPLQEHQIIDLGDLWLTKSTSEYTLWNITGEKVIGQLEQIQFDNNWIALKKGNKWALSEIKNLIIPEFVYDSVKLLNEYIQVLSKDGSDYVSFQNNQRLDLRNSSRLLLISAKDPDAKADSTDHLLSFDKDGVKRLYNIKGEKVLAGWFDEVKVINGILFEIRNKELKGISDTTGQNVLPIKYDAIGNDIDGNISILKDKKFGLFIYYPRKVIEPDYDAQIKPYNKELLIALKDGKYGIMNYEEEFLLPFSFDKINYWTDSTALLKSEDQWRMIHIRTQDTLMTLNDYQQVSDFNNEKTLLIKTTEGSGVINNKGGLIIQPSFDDLYNLGTEFDPFYFAGKYLPEIDHYIGSYFNKEGKIVWKDAISEEDYFKFICDQ